MIRARIPSQARAARSGALPSIVLVPRIVRRPTLGLDWILESSLTAWIEAARERGVHFDDPRLLLDPADASATPRLPRAVLVFDELRSVAYERVLPWLHDLGVPFAVCVATSRVGRSTGRRGSGERVPGWRELAAMAAVGAVLGTRGHFDVDHRALSHEQVFHDLTVARREMEGRLGIAPWLVRYPSGQVDARLAALAAQIGYRVGLCPSSSAPNVGDPLRWPVVRPRPWQNPQKVWDEIAVPTVSDRPRS